MKYKVGDKVRIKVFDELKLGYSPQMVQYQGQIHKISHILENNEHYEIIFPKKNNERNNWFYKEEWLEDPVEFEAF